MKEDSGRDLSKKWLLRYRVVSAVQALTAAGLKQSAALSAVAEQLHVDGTGQGHRFSVRTLRRWLAAFEEKGVAGLKDAAHPHSESSEVLPTELLDYLRAQKETDEPASIPELLRRAREEGALHPTVVVDRSTVWRALRRMGVSTRRVRRFEINDKRRFAFSQRMRLVLVDFVHFRVGPTRLRRLAIYFLDDATRYGLGVLVGTDGEKTVYCLQALLDVLRRYGRMLVVYMDHGPAFVADDLARVLSGLKIGFIHGRSRYPEGHGKIERFNRSLRARILRSLDGALDVDPDCGALALRLRHDLFDQYNHLPHESLDLDTPHQRWTSNATLLKPVGDEEILREAFVLPEERTVSNDHCISFGGVTYEVPAGLAGRKVTVLRALLEDDALYLDHDGRRIRLHPVDLADNATSGRACRTQPQERVDPPAKTASTLSFEREYGSILESDGGFPERDAADFLNRHKEDDNE